MIPEPMQAPPIQRADWADVLQRLTEQRRDERVSVQHYRQQDPSVPIEQTPRDGVVNDAALYALKLVEHDGANPEVQVLLRGDHKDQLDQIAVRFTNHVGIGKRLVRIQSDNGEGLELRFHMSA
jgi:hypothetical protein